MTHFTLTPGCEKQPKTLRQMLQQDTCTCTQGEQHRSANHQPDAVICLRIATALAIRQPATQPRTWGETPEILDNPPPCELHTTGG